MTFGKWLNDISPIEYAAFLYGTIGAGLLIVWIAYRLALILALAKEEKESR